STSGRSTSQPASRLRTAPTDVPSRGAGESALRASLRDHLGHAVAVFSRRSDGDVLFPGADGAVLVLLDFIENLAAVEERRQIVGVEREGLVECLERAVDVLGSAADRDNER